MDEGRFHQSADEDVDRSIDSADSWASMAIRSQLMAQDAAAARAGVSTAAKVAPVSILKMAGA